MKPNFFLVKGIHDIITRAKFGDDRLRGSGVVAGQISAFPIDFAGRPYNTHYRGSVWLMSSFRPTYKSFIQSCRNGLSASLRSQQRQQHQQSSTSLYWLIRDADLRSLVTFSTWTQTRFTPMNLLIRSIQLFMVQFPAGTYHLISSTIETEISGNLDLSIRQYYAVTYCRSRLPNLDVLLRDPF